MSDFRSKLKEIITTSFGEMGMTKSDVYSPKNLFEKSLFDKKQSKRGDSSSINKWRFDISLDKFKMAKKQGVEQSQTSTSKIDLTTCDSKQTKFLIPPKIEKDSQKVKLDISQCLNSALNIRNIKYLRQPATITKDDKNINLIKDETHDKKIEFKRIRSSSKSVSNQMIFDEQKYQMNRSRVLSMNSTAIGSSLGETHITNETKLIKEINKYRDNFKSGFIKVYQKPALTLNRPVFQMDSKSLWEFSPINVRKNYLVTGTRPKSMTKPSIHTLFINTQKSNENFLNIKLTNTHEAKNVNLDLYKSKVNRLKENKFLERKNFNDNLKSKN